MIVIKCNDCGNILNSEDKICNKCGCPVEGNVKRICSSCGMELRDGELTCNKCKIEDHDYIIKTDRTKSLGVLFKIIDTLNTIFGFLCLLSCVVMPFLIPFYALFIFIDYHLTRLNKENLTKSFIKLNDKEIYGEFYAILKVNKISFPLNKISSIRTIKLFRVINIVSIVADSGKHLLFFLVDNAEYFREEVIKQAKKNM